MKCPQCQGENADGKNFCSDCGTLLTPQLIPVIRNQVAEYLRDHFKDQTLVEIKTSEAVAARVLKWAKLYYAIPVAVLIVILALLGVSDYADFHKMIQRATDELKPKLNQAISEAETATTKAQAAEAKSDVASKTIDAATAKMNAQIITANQLSTKVSGIESTTANKIADASKHVEGRITDLDRKVEEANKTIAEQQSKLISTNELVTAMFSKSQVETFDTDKGNTSTFVLMPLPKTTSNGSQRAVPQAVVYMLLKYPAINQTVQLNFRIYVQPKSAFFVQGNLVTFFWGQSPESLKEWPLEVSYVPDPTYKGPVFKTMLLKDGRVVFDKPQTH